jgi:hypothetical protein
LQDFCHLAKLSTLLALGFSSPSTSSLDRCVSSISLSLKVGFHDSGDHGGAGTTLNESIQRFSTKRH